MQVSNNHETDESDKIGFQKGSNNSQFENESAEVQDDENDQPAKNIIRGAQILDK